MKRHYYESVHAEKPMIDEDHDDWEGDGDFDWEGDGEYDGDDVVDG